MFQAIRNRFGWRSGNIMIIATTMICAVCLAHGGRTQAAVEPGMICTAGTTRPCGQFFVSCTTDSECSTLKGFIACQDATDENTCSQGAKTESAIIIYINSVT